MAASKSPSRPSEKTVKRLFATYSNKRSFPNCTTPLVDVRTETVLGVICHIKGRKPGAARYDPSQSATERHAFENLILMCSVHHKVIDDDPTAYTVEHLHELKADHESKYAGGPEPSDEIANQFIERLQLLQDIRTAVVGHVALLTKPEKAARYMKLRAAIAREAWYDARGLLIGLEGYKDTVELMALIQAECGRLDVLATRVEDDYVAEDSVGLIKAVRAMGANAVPELVDFAREAWSKVKIPAPHFLHGQPSSAKSDVVALSMTHSGRFVVAVLDDRTLLVFDLTSKTNNVEAIPRKSLQLRYPVNVIASVAEGEELEVISKMGTQ